MIKTKIIDDLTLMNSSVNICAAIVHLLHDNEVVLDRSKFLYLFSNTILELRLIDDVGHDKVIIRTAHIKQDLFDNRV